MHNAIRKAGYSTDTSGWVCRSAWEKNTIPLSVIAYKRRPFGIDESKVQRMQKKLRKGKKFKRVIVVDKGDGPMIVVDGHHRLRAMGREGVKEAKAFVGTPRQNAGRWKHDIKAMQAEVMSRKPTGKGKGVRQAGNAYAPRDSDEVSGARQRPMNVVQVPESPQAIESHHGVPELVSFTPLEVTGELPLARPRIGDPLTPSSVPQDSSTYYGENGVAETSSFAHLD